jgi:phosphoinositide-specific phospholipase C-like protein
MATSEYTTGTEEEQFNLLSVLYHTLQGAGTYEQYIHEAQQASDQELVQFLREVQAEDRRRAERAKELLRQRLG